MGAWKSKNRYKYLLQYHMIFVCKYRKKLLVSGQITDDIKQFSYEICQKRHVIIRYQCCKEYFSGRIKANSIRKMYIGQELPELTPVEIVGCEVCEAGSPLALDDGWFTFINILFRWDMGSVLLFISCLRFWIKCRCSRCYGLTIQCIKSIGW